MKLLFFRIRYPIRIGKPNKYIPTAMSLKEPVRINPTAALFKTLFNCLSPSGRSVPTMTMMEPLSSFALFCIFVHICLPTGTPATVRSCVFPKLDCTKTPIVYSLPPNVKILDAEPIPPFNPKQTVPLPAPTAPCLKFFSACSIAKSTSSASITVL